MTSKLSNALRMVAVHQPDGIKDKLRKAADVLDLTINSLGLSGAANSYAFTQAKHLYLVGKRRDLVVDEKWLLPTPKGLVHKD